MLAPNQPICGSQQAGLRPGPGSAPSRAAQFWLHYGSGARPGGCPCLPWTKRNQALRCWVRVRVGDGVVISWRVGHWRALGAPRECPWNVPSRCWDRMFQTIMSRIMFNSLEPGKRVPIIMSRIMFYYVRNYVREFCANLNQTGWFK